MTTKSRVLLGVFAASGVFITGTANCAGTLASRPSATPTKAQYAAIADDICAGVPAKERDMGLLAYRDAMVSVAPLRRDIFVGKVETTRTEGAIIGMRAMPGISVPWLERVDSCHVALVGSGRLAGDEQVVDPFTLPGATVGATEVYAGFVVSVKGASYNEAQEILRQSQALLSEPSPSPTAELGAR